MLKAVAGSIFGTSYLWCGSRVLVWQLGLKCLMTASAVAAELLVDRACVLDAGIGVADPVPTPPWVGQG